FSSRRRHTRLQGDWSSDVCSSDLGSPDHGPGPKHLVSSDRPEPAEIRAEYLQGHRGGLPEGHSARVSLRAVCVIRATAGAMRDRSEERRVGKEWRCEWTVEHVAKW